MAERLKTYKTVGESAENETVINKSRFISRVFPISSEEEANKIIAETKKEHYKATHVCSAWVLATDPLRQKASDDGEPSGTAGRPILDVLLKQNLRNVLVLVIRYFGGIKLGAGGLVRAYSGGCADVLKTAQIVEVKETDTILVQTEYSFYQGLKLMLEKLNIFPVKEEFSDVTELTFLIPVEKTEKFIKLIEDFTNDNYLAEIINTGPVGIPENEADILL